MFVGNRKLPGDHIRQEVAGCPSPTQLGMLPNDGETTFFTRVCFQPEAFLECLSLSVNTQWCKFLGQEVCENAQFQFRFTARVHPRRPHDFLPINLHH